MTYYNYTAWTADGEVSVKDDRNTVPAKGDIVELSNNSDGTVTSRTLDATEAVGEATIVPVAVIGFNGADRTATLALADGTILNSAPNMKYSEDVEFMYVNTKDVVGIAGGEVDLAEQQADGSYVLNAYAIYTCTTGPAFDELTAIVYDMNNDLENEGTSGYTVSLTDSITAGSNMDNAAVASLSVTQSVDGDTVDVIIKANASGTTVSGAGVDFTANGVTVNVPAGTYAANAVMATITVPAAATVTVTSADAS